MSLWQLSICIVGGGVYVAMAFDHLFGAHELYALDVAGAGGLLLRLRFSFGPNLGRGGGSSPRKSSGGQGRLSRYWVVDGEGCGKMYGIMVEMGGHGG